SKMLNAHGVLGVLLSEGSGHRCLKRILFDFNVISRIEHEEVLKAIDITVALVEKCPEHKEVSPQISNALSVCKACTALLKTLSAEYDLLTTRKTSLPPMLHDMVKFDDVEKSGTQHRANCSLGPLSIQNEQNLMLLGLVPPQKPSDLPNYLRLL